MIGTGPFQERVEFEEFNTAEVSQYRGVLDDIAKEIGDRVQKIAPTDPTGQLPYDPSSVLRKLLPELTAAGTPDAAKKAD